MTLTRWNPRSNDLETTDSFRTIEDWMDEMWRQWTGSSRSRSDVQRTLRPAMDVIETDQNVQARIDLPGLNPDDVHVEVNDDVLTIRGEMGDTVEEENDRYHYRERRYGSFQRSLRLPKTLDQDHIDASFENGVLTITLPKLPQAQPKQIKVRAGEHTNGETVNVSNN